MRKATVIGHFDWNGNNMIGAVVKARNIYEQMRKDFGDENIYCVDIYEWRKSRLLTMINIFKAFSQSKNIVLVISDTSLFMMRFFSLLKMVFHPKILYCVVGGDIAEKLIEKKEGVAKLRPIDMFFVETSDCLDQMHSLGLRNTVLMRNFKCITPIKLTVSPRYNSSPFRFCTFSRVIKQKGITDAICAIEEINQEAGEKLCQLDIYGAIDPSYAEEFSQLERNAKYSEYCGVIDSSKAVDILKNYYCLLFPTKYQTEGIPGTIIDGFAAGLPVICSNWKRCKELIDDGKNGFVFPFGEYDELKKKIIYSIKHVDEVEKMRLCCVTRLDEYNPENAIKPLLDCLR